MELATFGGGCFWGTEAFFQKIEGVKSTTVGYCGGTVENPTYQQVCQGPTGHAEVVQVEFDPEVVSYEELLDYFWDCHNPTTLNRQGADVGTQYRSIIFYHNPDQEKKAKASKRALEASGRFKDPIVTEISTYKNFYKAEDYHQKYLEKQGKDSCHI